MEVRRARADFVPSFECGLQRPAELGRAESGRTDRQVRVDRLDVHRCRRQPSGAGAAPWDRRTSRQRLRCTDTTAIAWATVGRRAVPAPAGPAALLTGEARHLSPPLD